MTLVALGDVAPVPDAEPGVPVFTDHRALLAATAPDVVIVCTPPHTHLAIAEDALRSGADVLLEKPPVLDTTEHDRLSAVVADTGRACQVGFQALGSPALAELLSIVDGGGVGTLQSIAVVGAWKRDESYFRRAAWAGRADLLGSRVLDGALANPFAHAVMQVLAIARQQPRLVEVERYRAHDIQVDDTAALRLTFDGGLRALVAVTLCAEEFVAGEITVSGTAATAVLEYPTDRLRGPADPALRAVPGRVGLLENLVAHRRDSTVALVAPLSRTLPFTRVLEPVTAAPVRAIDHSFLRTVDDLPQPRVGDRRHQRRAPAGGRLARSLLRAVRPVGAARRCQRCQRRKELPMKKLSLADLTAQGAGPVLADALPGYHIERGGITRYETGARSHPEGHHVHTVPEVFVILQGSGVIEIDGAQTPFQAGDVLVVAAGEDHHLVSHGPLPLLSAWMHLTPAGSTTR